MYHDSAVHPSDATRDADLGRWKCETHYHLGRLLFERGKEDDLGEAVAWLQQAAAQHPNDPRIDLHLGLAMHAQIRRQTLAEANRLLYRYLEAGAPLGRAAEVGAALAFDATGSGLFIGFGPVR
jgi:Flp pilus assembly protein TadD